MDNLPSSALTHIASFLAVPSRALFAVALSSANNDLTTEESLAIIGNQWDILDFGEIHKELAAKLTDDDIRDILLSVNAADRLKRLRLDGCIGITGSGLEPLRGSLVIEQIDLSLWIKDKEMLDHASISCDHVLPVLDSIIENETCALKHLHFPKAWRRERLIYSDFHQFLLRYNQMWARRQEALSCMNCSASLPQRCLRWDGRWVHDVGAPWIHTEPDDEVSHVYPNHFYYGIQYFHCHECLKHYCRNCCSDNGLPYHYNGQGKLLRNCGRCNRLFCADCSPLRKCFGINNMCHAKLCSGCNIDEITCRNCGSVFCDSCVGRGYFRRHWKQHGT